MNEQNEQINRMINFDHLIFGIGQVSQMTGVSARQLRYWESQGYIEAMNSAKGAPRQYGLKMVMKIIHISHFQANGYTLQAAVDKASKVSQEIPVLKEFMKLQLNGVTIEEDKSTIDFGYLNSDKQQKIYGILENGTTRFEIKDV